MRYNSDVRVKRNGSAGNTAAPNHYSRERTAMADIDVTTKTCSLCKTTYPASLEYFHRDKRIRGGLKAACKNCTNQKQGDFRTKHPEKLLEYTKRYHVRHSQELVARSREWQQANPQKRHAQDAVHSAVRAGKIQRATSLTCVHGGVRCKGAATGYHHHRGYDKEHWLDVIPVCSPCHVELEKGKTS